MDREHNAFHIQLERMDDKLALYLFFPFRLARLGGSVGGSAGVSGSCVSSSTFGSVISRTENQLLLSNGGARLTRCGIQNPLH